MSPSPVIETRTLVGAESSAGARFLQLITESLGSITSDKWIRRLAAEHGFFDDDDQADLRVKFTRYWSALVSMSLATSSVTVEPPRRPVVWRCLKHCLSLPLYQNARAPPRGRGFTNISPSSPPTFLPNFHIHTLIFTSDT